MKNIYEHIRKARIEAQRQFIATNTIIIDKEIAYTNNLFVQDNNIIGEYPPMIFGMKVLYDDNLPNNANFVITQTPKNKMEQIQNIEEELGIDLITLFKALTKGIYIKDDNLIDHLTGLQLDFSLITNEYSFYCDYYIQYYRLKDYGKTWWLEKPKEELENE